MPQKKRKKSKVRYDRIISVIVIMILAIYAGKQLFKSNSEKDIPVSAPEAEEPFEPVIYLSPSNQTDNPYAAGNTTEAEMMRNVSESVKKYLEQNGVTVYVAEPGFSLQEKIDFANENNVTAHVAIHSNAGGDSGGGEGTECFYNPKVLGSKVLAEYIYSRVSRLTPTDDRGMFDGTQGSAYLYEVATSEVPNCLIEVEFHDSIERAQWIIDHTDELGKSIADGIMQYIGYAEEMHEQKYTESSETENGEQN